MTEGSTEQSFVKIRKKAGLTQRQVAEAIGVTVTTVSSWETGTKEPRLDFIQTRSLMELFHCSIDDLAEALESMRSVKQQKSEG